MKHVDYIDNKKKKLRIYYSLLITVICIIGVSFAWFRLFLSQNEDNTLASRKCFSTTLTEDTSKIALTDAFPITDAKGLKQTPFTFTLKNNCSSYAKVYITIDSAYRESTSSSYLKDDYIKVNISPKGTTKNQSAILGKQTLTGIDSSTKGYIIIDTSLNANEEKSYDLRIWMDSAVTAEQGLNKVWAGKIVVIASATELPKAPENWYSASDGELLAALRTDNDISTPLTTPGKEISSATKDDISETETKSVDPSSLNYYITYGTDYEANGNAFNLTGTAVTTDTYANSYESLIGKYIPDNSLARSGSSTLGEMVTTSGLDKIYYIVNATSSNLTYKIIYSNKNKTEASLLSTEDDYGTSLYFRGAVKNNYVQFANKCWRIVRITGNGSIKLVLHNDNIAGTSNPCSSSNNTSDAAFARYSGTTYTSAWNSNYNDNTYIGFMYGAAGASSYTSTHANTNKSTILKNLETWYKNNLSSYENKLADVIWCNDKSTFSTYLNGTSYGSNLGYGTNSSTYTAYNRIYGSDDIMSSNYAAPSLICPNDNNGGKLSKFTVSDTINGNGNLTYKIGLLTADELLFAGMKAFVLNPDSIKNISSYIYENASSTAYWTLSPNSFNGTRAFISVEENGVVDLNSGLVTSNKFGIRPSIALNTDVTVTGSGTSEDPYIVQ